ncbi:hypothetical protein EF910_21905 [Streptomyces sp. WAC07149]|uniref:hypothetical protein n=1 Tax=Streptomyces sp. WAC07149 TaxID=2487425 RepID=UPI000F76E8FD|nr:hypothetical protein [Streptomyces sp. WAC07149]RST02942.1 hypothetical protein EF910_21905 [Streptomyces sp. WAC07149]
MSPIGITRVTPVQRDVRYDHEAGQSRLPVTVHLGDGATEETVLVLTPAQAELLHIQTGQAIDLRERELSPR